MNKDFGRLMMLFELAQDVVPCGNAKLAAGLYIKNDLVSVGINQVRTSPFAMKYGKNEKAACLHAETHAIKQALRHFSVDELTSAKTTLYVARAKRTGQGSEFQTGLAKPCLGCIRSIIDFNIKRI